MLEPLAADFCLRSYNSEASAEILTQFLSLHQPEAVYIALQYRQLLIEAKLAPSTINIRLSALKSLVDYARTIEQCSFNLADVHSLKVESYRDTTGIAVSGFKEMLQIPDRSTIKGTRDYAILRLLLVREFSTAAGIDKIVSPHRIGHSAITAYLDASDGNIRAAQGLSRHASLNTLNRYDDNRHKFQAIATNTLADLV